MDYYTSTANYNNSGSSFDLTSGSSYQLVQTPAGARYVLTDKWALSTDLMISTATSKNLGTTRGNSTLTEIHLGTDMLLYQGAGDLIGIVNGIYSFETINTGQDNAMNAEGVTQVKGLVSFQQNREFILWYVQGGYNYRASGRSGQFLWNLGTGMNWTKFSLGAELGGLQTVMNDEDTNRESARYNLIQQVNAGSYRFYSVNPSMVDFRLWSEFKMGQASVIGVGASQSVYGLNYSKGLTVSAYLTLGFDVFSGKKQTPISNPLNEESALSTEKKIEKFEPAIDDGVDQRLFQPPPPPPKVDKTKPVPNQTQLQNQLNEAEMSIQLKRQRKKK